MIDLAVIILTKDEKLHIGRCVERLAPLGARQMFVVDCISTDGTQQIAKDCGATVVEHTWPGNQARQFNWALNNLPIKAQWAMRLDADEYLSEGLVDEIKAFVANPQADISLVEFPLGRMWRGKRIRFGMPTVFVPRLFRFGLCRYGDMEMDERLISDSGRTIRFRSVFIDDNLNGLDWWKAKHRNYAEREARQALGVVHGKKSFYYKIPPYARAVAYWLVRYFLFCGFLDGRSGWNWNFWQGLWYRCLVDKNIQRMKRENACKK